MKNLIIATVVALSATVSFANDVNIKKVNKVVKQVVESEQTEIINKIVVKFDEKSDLSSVETLKTGILLSATAKESAWSKRSTSIDVNADFKTLTSDAAHTKAQLNATIGSKTNAVALYAYIANKQLEDSANQPINNETDQEFRDWFTAAAQVKNLEQIPAQLEKFIAIVKKALAAEQGDEYWADFLNSLKVDTKVQNFKTTEVVIKTSKEVAIDFFGAKLLISDLGAKISNDGLSFGVAIAGTTETTEIAELLESVKGFLNMVQNADKETLAELKDMAGGYVSMAEMLITGKEE